jgi:tetratricopeptide (TPR) repeat protein
MRTWTLALLAALLAACAPAPVARQETPRFTHDALFAPPSERVDASQVFALSDEMRRYLAAEILPQSRVKGRQVALIDALYNRSQLKLVYDSSMTRNAAEAYASRSGNCLSLVIMTSAFAKALGLGVRYQKVFVEDALGREGDIYMAIGHVNLTLETHRTDESIGFRVGKRPPESEALTVDFLPQEDLRGLRAQAIDEATVVAMYTNNRAVEALADGRVDDAYWWAREAVAQAPGYLPAFNTLGVVYQRHGDPREAEPVLRYVLERDPRNTQAMSNLVAVLAAQGRIEESRRLAATLERIDPEPPFAWFLRGMAALRAGDFAAAKDAFEKEVARAPDYHEFHFWLAIALLGLGQGEEARAHVALALENSTTRRDHDLYAAKLAKLSRHAPVVH